MEGKPERVGKTAGRVLGHLASETLSRLADQTPKQPSGPTEPLPTVQPLAEDDKTGRRLKPGEFDRGVSDAVQHLDGEFTWEDVHRWLTDHGIHMSAKQPQPMINKKLRSLSGVQSVAEGGGGHPPVFKRAAEQQ